MKTVLFALFIFAFNAPSWAQVGRGSRIIGNGGDVFVCADGLPVRLLDFEEARVLYSHSVRLHDPVGRTYQEKLTSLMERIRVRFPRFSTTLAREIANFELHNIKPEDEDFELRDVPDDFSKISLKGCKPGQIANQNTPMFDDEPWYVILKPLWEGMNEFHKAGLVLHEVIYRLGLQFYLEHSVGVRKLVGLLFHEDLSEISDKLWIQAFRHSKIKYYETGGVRFPLFRGEPAACEIVPGTLDCAPRQREVAWTDLTFDSLKRVHRVQFPMGLESFEFATADGVDGEVLATGAFLEFEGAEATLSVRDAKVIVVLARGRLGAEQYQFYLNGKLRPLSGTIEGRIRSENVDGSPNRESERNYSGSLSQLILKRRDYQP